MKTALRGGISIIKDGSCRERYTENRFYYKQQDKKIFNSQTHAFQ